MTSKTYTFVKVTVKYNKLHYTVISKHRINCLGGENKNMDLTKMVFVNTKEVPNRNARTGVDWGKYFNAIPKDQAWILDAETSDFKLSTVKSAVKDFVKKNPKSTLKALQRSKNGKVLLYVSL